MKKDKKPAKIITLDTETYNGLLGRLKRIAIYDGQEVTYGYSFADVEPVLLGYHKEGYNVYVYIHNMEFDARKIPEIFEKARINWKKSRIINGKLVRIACKKYTFQDSFRLLPMSLAKLSKGFHVEHGKLNLWNEVQKVYPDQYKDLVDFLDRCDPNDPLFIKYLGYDVMSLYEIITKLMDIAGLKAEEFVDRITTSSLSRYIYKNGWKGHVFRQPGKKKTDYEMLTAYNWTSVRPPE